MDRLDTVSKYFALLCRFLLTHCPRVGRVLVMRSGPAQLKEWIERRGFNYQEASRYLGIDPSVLTKLANGTRHAGLTIALIIERKTGIPVESWASVDLDTQGSAVVAGPRKRKSDK